MTISQEDVREARTMLRDTGMIKRVASRATVIESTDGLEWFVISPDANGGNGVYETVFSGPQAKERAVEYASEKYSGFRFYED